MIPSASSPAPSASPRFVPTQPTIMPATIHRLPTQNDLIVERLTAAAGEWVSMLDLVKASDSYNVHTRIDELRHTRGLAIENKTERAPNKRIHSCYRLLPA